jgi:hypothetical protein
MSVTIKTLIESQFIANAATEYYTCPSGTKTIIDKITCTNTHSSAITVSIYLVPADQTVAENYQIIDTLSIAANTARDMTELQNHILNEGEAIHAIASTGGEVVIRGSGREIV